MQSGMDYGIIRGMDEKQEQQVVREKNGNWIVPPKSPAPITHANARSMAEKRWAKYRQEAVKRITDEIASIEPGVSTGAAAYGVIAAKQAVALLDSEKPRISDLEKLGNIMTGANLLQQGSSRDTERAANEISATPSALLEFIRVIELDKQFAVDRARAVDADTIQNTE